MLNMDGWIRFPLRLHPGESLDDRRIWISNNIKHGYIFTPYEVSIAHEEDAILYKMKFGI